MRELIPGRDRIYVLLGNVEKIKFSTYLLYIYYYQGSGLIALKIIKISA